MSNIKAIHDHIVFKFEDPSIRRGGKEYFKEYSEAGLEVVSFKESLDRPRWGIVVTVGKDVKEITPGMRILIENLKWTNSFRVDGEDYWRTEISHVLGYDEEYTLPQTA